MSINGVIKTNKKRVTSIDGIRPTSSATKKTNSTKRLSNKQSVVHKRTTQTPEENVVKITTFSKPTPVISAKDEFLSPVESFDLNISSEEITKEKPEKKAPEPKKKKKHVFRKILIILLILLAGTLAVAMIWGNEIISKITGGKSNILDAFSLITETYDDLDTDQYGRTNFLLFGTSGYYMNGSVSDEYSDIPHDGAQLTDSIMLVSLDQKTGDVAMVNIPRDLKVGKTCTSTGKINEIYWCNTINIIDEKEAEKTGADALRNKISEILNIDIQYYAHINWGSLMGIVNALDGITVTLDEDIYDYDEAGSNIEANVPTRLTGVQTVALARARHGASNGDFSRGNSQQKILIAIKERILEKDISLEQALELISALGDNLRTDISLSNIKTGIHLMKSLDLTKMRQLPLLDWDQDIILVKTAMINNISYVIPSSGDGNYLSIQKYINQKLNSNPVIREGSKIAILNGSNISGVAAMEQEKLEDEGFIVSYIDDAPEGEYDELEIYILNEDMVETKNILSEFYNNTVIRLAEDLPDNIVSNADFVIILGSTDLSNEE